MSPRGRCKNPEWNNTTVIGGNVAGEVAKLKAGDGGPILVGGSRMLVHTLLGEDLVDELRVMIFPVILGSGRRLFPDSPRKIVLQPGGHAKIRIGRGGEHVPPGREGRALLSRGRSRNR